jgi:hypothetical protein
MSDRTLILGTVLAIAIVLVVLGLDEASYLQRGYDLALGFAGESPSVVHTTFPVWLKVAHGLIGLGALSTLAFTATMHRAAVPLAWGTLGAAIAMGYYDVIQYGTLGSPTSIKTILLLFLLCVLATYWRRREALR